MSDKKESKKEDLSAKSTKELPAKTDKIDLGLLEEDDEFEEFPAEVWKDISDNEEELNIWEDNWDDDNIEDDFSKQLKTELEKKKF